jgi:predicted ferric reductase
MLAHRFLTETDGFPKRPVKALWLFKESASLGDVKAYAFIGISWVANKNLDNANKAWREFYNHVYDEIEASNSQLPSEKAEDYLKTFLSIFDCAIDNKCTNLIHRYYVIATFILGYFDYFSKKCEELEEEYDTLTEKLPEDPIEATDISELSEEEIDLLTNYTRVQKEKDTLEKVYRYIREVGTNLQKEYGNTTAMIYRIED